MLNTSIELIAFNPIVFVSFFCFDKFVPCSTERVVSIQPRSQGSLLPTRPLEPESRKLPERLLRRLAGRTTICSRNGVDKSKGTGSGTRSFSPFLHSSLELKLACRRLLFPLSRRSQSNKIEPQSSRRRLQAANVTTLAL